MQMTNEQLAKAAPSIFAQQPWVEVSDKYTFIPTIDVVEAMRAEGFFPVKATQSRSRIEGKGDFTKHLIRFRREGVEDLPRVVNGNAHFFYAQNGLTAPEFPELVLTNSHDRSSGFQLSAGIYRQVCLQRLHHSLP
jgi:Domain of unknown function (DUF932)